MTVTIDHEGRRVSVTSDDATTVDDAVELVRAALLAVGYHPDNVRDALGE